MRYDIYWKDECVGYFEVDIAQGKLLKNHSETEDIVINPFALKTNFDEIERVLEGRRYSKDRRVKINELRSGFYDVWNEVNMTLSSDYNDAVKVVREDLSKVARMIGNKGNQEKFILEDRS